MPRLRLFLPEPTSLLGFLVTCAVFLGGSGFFIKAGGGLILGGLTPKHIFCFLSNAN